MKTAYFLKIRESNSEPWGEPEFYPTKKERDEAAAMNRIIGGMRTHSYQEKVSDERFEELEVFKNE